MGLKEKTINFLLFSGTTKSLIRNHQKIKEELHTRILKNLKEREKYSLQNSAK